MRHRALIATALAATTVLACPLPAAHATFRGKRGPIVFERLLNPMDESSAQLFALSRRTGRLHRLTNFPGGAYNPAYSPDGARIAFERHYPNGPDRIFTITAAGRSAVQVPLSCSGKCLGTDEPAWGPGGGRLLFGRAFGPVVNGNASNLAIATARLGGSGDHAIRNFGGTGTEPHGAVWSPNGKLIAVTIQNTTNKTSAIYLLNAKGKTIRRLTPPKLEAGNPDWAPDGKRLVFNSFYEGQSESELYTVRVNGTHRLRLRKEKKNNYAFDPVWSPDGARIAFVHTSRNAPPHIWSLGANGRKLRQETHGPLPDFTPSWGAAAG